MITYQIDKATMTNASSQIKDMAVVLKEIAPTLQILLNLLDEHEKSLSTPSVDAYRTRLKRLVADAITISKSIAEKSQQLCVAGDQAAKHLSAIEEHFGATLRGGTETAKEPRNTVTVS